jgi:hypothetical protein
MEYVPKWFRAGVIIRTNTSDKAYQIKDVHSYSCTDGTTARWATITYGDSRRGKYVISSAPIDQLAPILVNKSFIKKDT